MAGAGTQDVPSRTERLTVSHTPFAITVLKVLLWTVAALFAVNVAANAGAQEVSIGSGGGAPGARAKVSGEGVDVTVRSRDVHIEATASSRGVQATGDLSGTGAQVEATAKGVGATVATGDATVEASVSGSAAVTVRGGEVRTGEASAPASSGATDHRRAPGARDHTVTHRQADPRPAPGPQRSAPGPTVHGPLTSFAALSSLSSILAGSAVMPADASIGPSSGQPKLPPIPEDPSAAVSSGGSPTNGSPDHVALGASILLAALGLLLRLRGGRWAPGPAPPRLLACPG